MGGDEWAKTLRSELAKSDVVVVVIGPKWHTAWCDKVGPRLWHPHDWVRKEICTAITKGKITMPLLVDGATMPVKGALPKNCALSKITDFTPNTISAKNFVNDMEVFLKTVAEKSDAMDKFYAWRGNKEKLDREYHDGQRTESSVVSTRDKPRHR